MDKNWLYGEKKSRSVTELLNFIRDIKSKELRSNANFVSPNFLGDLIVENKAWISIGDTSAIILCSDTENILRLSYYAKDGWALKEIPSLLPKTNWHIVCDIIGKNPKVEQQVDELQQTGFNLYAKFQRMMCNDIRVDPNIDLSDVEFAKECDAQEISEITHKEFDPLTARMHSLEELVKLIKREEVLLVRRNGRIAGFCIFDSKNKKVALLDHVIVRPEYRLEKIGKKMLNYKWKFLNDSQYYILWINVLCSGPIQYHRKNGFAEDGLYDYILTFEKV